MTAPQKFRTKPVYIEAMQVTNDPQRKRDIQAWAESVKNGEFVGVSVNKSTGNVIVHSPNGILFASTGGWVIREAGGHFYYVSSKDFEREYELDE